MGVLPRIEALATGTTRMTVHREGVKRPFRVDLTKVYAAASDRHVEIMRDDLSEIYYDAGRDERRVSVGDSITATSRRRCRFRARSATPVRHRRRRRRSACEREAYTKGLRLHDSMRVKDYAIGPVG